MPQIGFTFLESEPSTLTVVGLAGAIVTPLAPETWSVDISLTGIGSLDAFYWSSFIFNRVYVDDDPGFINVVSRLDATHFLVMSDVDFGSFVPSAGSFCGTAGPIVLGVTCFVGYTNSTDDYFAVWDYAPVPEPSTAMLLGLGMVGLATGRRRAAAREQ